MLHMKGGKSAVLIWLQQPCDPIMNGTLAYDKRPDFAFHHRLAHDNKESHEKGISL